jgi:hypothetical protein
MTNGTTGFGQNGKFLFGQFFHGSVHRCKLPFNLWLAAKKTAHFLVFSRGSFIASGRRPAFFQPSFAARPGLIFRLLDGIV